MESKKIMLNGNELEIITKIDDDLIEENINLEDTLDLTKVIDKTMDLTEVINSGEDNING